MKSRWRLKVAILACLVAAVVLGSMMLLAQNDAVSGTAWNDPTVLAGPDGQPRWAEHAPTVDDPDRPYLVTSPPAAEVASGMSWVQRLVNPGVLPAELKSHLLALKRRPKYGAEDVFVTWYLTDARLVHIVEGNADLTVFTVLLGEERTGTPRRRAKCGRARE